VINKPVSRAPCGVLCIAESTVYVNLMVTITNISISMSSMVPRGSIVYRLKKEIAAKLMAASSNDVPTEFAYTSPQALVKAVNKVSNLLPNSPRKKRAVISKLAKSSGISCSNKTQQDNKTQGNMHIPT
jgi:hypothetical protein